MKGVIIFILVIFAMTANERMRSIEARLMKLEQSK